MAASVQLLLPRPRVFSIWIAAMDMPTFPMTPIEDIAALSGVEFFRQMADGKVPPGPFQKLVGLVLVSVEKGRLVYKSTPGPQHNNPLGVGHGGYATTLLDTAMGCAVQTMCPPGWGSTTLELKVNLVRAITENVGELTTEGKVIHNGRTTATSEARITDANGKLYAHSTCTCLIIRIGS